MDDDDPSPGTPPGPTHRGTAGALAPGLGLMIGDFLVERRLGAGGMGVVYRARQVSLDRVVALKVLGDAMDRPSDIARFRREAQAVARLDHPGIAGVYFVGQDGRRCFMAMELIDGASLRRAIDAIGRDPDLTLDGAVAALAGPGAEVEAEAPVVRFDDSTATLIPGVNDRPGFDGSAPGPRPRATPPAHVRRSAEIARDAARALAHAHSRGVVHRDIKPENILLDRRGDAHLIDFGIARFFDDATVTSTGQIVGTPMYMSPEQVVGRLGIDHRTDIYSLGMVLYELLTLGRPVAGLTREAVLRHAVTKALPPVAATNPNVPPALAAVVHMATSKDPDDRYQDAEAFAADIQAALDGRPVAAPTYRFRPDRREIDGERPASILAIAFELALIAGSALLWTSQLSAMPADARETIGFGGPLAPMVVTGVGAAAIVLGVAWAIFSGRRWGRWAGMVGSLGWLALCGRFLYGFLDGRYRLEANLFFATAGPTALMAATAAASFACLASKRAADWFRLAPSIRREHGRR